MYQVELQNYYSNIEGCYGNCGCCCHYYFCDLIVELLENPEEKKEELSEKTEKIKSAIDKMKEAVKEDNGE